MDASDREGRDDDRAAALRMRLDRAERVGGLVDDSTTVYFVIKTGDNTLKLAATAEKAEQGIAIAFTSAAPPMCIERAPPWPAPRRSSRTARRST